MRKFMYFRRIYSSASRLLDLKICMAHRFYCPLRKAYGVCSIHSQLGVPIYGDLLCFGQITLETVRSTGQKYFVIPRYIDV